MKAYMCVICGFVYEEAKGAPDHGLVPGTLWKDVPENWTCPDCGAPKSISDLGGDLNQLQPIGAS